MLNYLEHFYFRLLLVSNESDWAYQLQTKVSLFNIYIKWFYFQYSCCYDSIRRSNLHLADFIQL